MNLKRSSITAIFLTITLSWMIGYTSPSQGQAVAFSQAVVWPQIQLTNVTGGLSSPVAITHAGDGSGRLFVVEQAGRIQIVKNGVLQTGSFLDIQNQVLFNGEQGLLGLAFPPGYAGKGYFYVYYTNKDGDNEVARFHLTGSPDQADPGSEERILLLNHPSYSNHNGGQLAFGSDGYLYIGTGDGGGGGDPQHNAQNLGALLGKILRIDVEFSQPNPVAGPYKIYIPLALANRGRPPYLIPVSNPYANTPGARGEIWAFGARNPWRFSFDRQTSDLYIADVGQDQYEEVDFQPASSLGGENYGWNIMEGMHCYGASSCNQAGLVLPVLEYAHGPGESNGCSITGGYVYRGPGNPGMQGFYFYGDYCSGRIWAGIRDGGTWQSHELLDTAHSISTFGEDQDGNLYLADRGAGVIYQITQAP